MIQQGSNSMTQEVAKITSNDEIEKGTRKKKENEKEVYTRFMYVFYRLTCGVGFEHSKKNV